MTIKNGDLPAMPTHQVWQDCGIDGNSGPHYVETISAGLTKREYFAALAMQACRSRNSSYASWSDLATDAVEIADALLTKLENSK